MMFYGDRARTIPTAAKLAEVGELMRAAASQRPGIERHGALVEALIGAGELLQGVADAEFQICGEDEETPAQAAASALLRSLAEAVAISWASDFAADVEPDFASLEGLKAQVLSEQITCKVAEGYAYYAVYPEAYLEAASDLAPASGATVIGIRSIGTGLAAIVAAALGPDAKTSTVRPFGHPFDRKVKLGAALLEGLARRDGLQVVVDEGPGLSGSSFAAVWEMLHTVGIDASRVVFMPSHGGEPGPRAGDTQRRSWASVLKAHKDFDAVFVETKRPAHRLEHWIGDLIGPVVAPLQDISAGRWRDATHQAPAIARYERRKFLARTAEGTYLLKFAGLASAGRDKATRARLLAEAEFTPPVLGLRHGFLVQSWQTEARPLDLCDCDRGRLIAWLGSYFAFRAERFQAAPEDGGPLPELLHMMRVNVAKALGEEIAAVLEARVAGFAETARPPRAIHVDGRLHSWEWLVLPDGRLLKTDAVDHSCQHDLVGCQDLAWDIAGARLELELDARETEDLLGALTELGERTDTNLLAVFTACYAAFQLGLWQSDAAASPEDGRLVAAHAKRYRKALLDLAA